MSISECHQESFYCFCLFCFAFVFVLLVFLVQSSSVWFYYRSLDYLLSESWLPKQCYVPSHGVGLKSNHIFIDYFHKVFATNALAYFSGRTDCRSAVLWLGCCPCFSFYILQSSYPNQRDQNIGVRLHIGTSQTFLCTRSCVNVALSNGALMSVCEGQPLSQHHSGFYQDFHGLPLPNHSTECNPDPLIKRLACHKCYPEILYLPLLGVLISTNFIDSGKFPLFYVSTLPPNAPQTNFSHLSLALSLHTISLLT